MILTLAAGVMDENTGRTSMATPDDKPFEIFVGAEKDRNILITLPIRAGLAQPVSILSQDPETDTTAKMLKLAEDFARDGYPGFAHLIRQTLGVVA